MRWLVTGAGGMLGVDVVAALRQRGDDVTALDRSHLDITDVAAVEQVIKASDPDVVVNCAAWTDVDGAEDHEREALAVNGDGARHVALACRGVGARLVHMSTDYVFRGNAAYPYAEDAPTDPINAYGRTKLAGERAVVDVLPESSYVVRTAWLYGEHGRSFVRTMLRLERERDTVDVVDDQLGQPTWTADLAQQIVVLVESGAPAGPYHATNAGAVTWYGFAQEIFRAVGADPERVLPTTSAAFKRPAARPAFSVLGHDRWEQVGLRTMRTWSDALSEAVGAFMAA